MNDTMSADTISADTISADTSGAPETTEPSPSVHALDRLVGTWRVSGGAEGSVRFEWMEGGHFLLQHVDLTQYGERHTGLEVIGQLRPFGGAPSEDVHSRFYGDAGDTLDYVYEIQGDVMMIWCGEKGSPAYCRSVFSPDGRTLAGAWTYPGGGGYEYTITRVDGELEGVAARGGQNP